jgi:hypothetical protein
MSERVALRGFLSVSASLSLSLSLVIGVYTKCTLQKRKSRHLVTY